MSLIPMATASSFKTKVEIQLKNWNAPFAASDVAALRWFTSSKGLSLALV
jgi:hypothetical protein